MALVGSDGVFAAQGLISTQPGASLALVCGYSGSSATRWLQLFNTAALPAPGTKPRHSILVPAGATFSFAASALAKPFGAGAYWAVSDTGPTLTLSADSFWVYWEGQSGQ